MLHTLDKKYVQVIVVQPSMFQEYCEAWGKTHMILELPAEITKLSSENVTVTTMQKVENGGREHFV